MLSEHNALKTLLASYRDAARTERDKGTYFERLAIAFLTHDPMQAEQYESVLPYAEWAAANGWDGRDTGIDLVAKLRDEDGYAAIQCKFYAPDHRIQKRDIDSFISASGKAPFRRRVVMDTTDLPWSDNAETMLRGQSIPTLRIGLADLQESPIRWGAFAARGEVILRTKKTLRPHQVDALDAVRTGLQEADRGKMIMACGTGKTFTSLKIAEDLVGPGGSVLFLVPSLALMAQTIREWSADAGVPLRAFSACSDTQVGKRTRSTEDVAEIDILDLAFPATTDPARLATGARIPAPDKMTVVFATYQSIQVIADAQQNHGLAPFGLIICDEAHRTTGVTLADEDESNFVKVHSNANVQGAKRLYMTATPRIFSDTGSFVTRLLQSGLIAPEEMAHKFRHEIHANEIVLLAYYIAAINIEAVYHGLMGEDDYVPFEGICLTDTYAARSSATNKNALYDSYIRAIRWASDRLGDSGVLAFVTNGGWVDANTADGLRQCLVEDFSTLYVFHLRGNQRTSGERSRREGCKVFGGGSRAPVAINVFVKTPEATEQGRILFRDIGDYLSREDKLRTIQAFGSIGAIARADRSRFCQRSYSPGHSPVSREITADDRQGPLCQ